MQEYHLNAPGLGVHFVEIIGIRNSRCLSLITAI